MPLIPKRKPTGTFEVGAGYSTDHGFAFMARIAQTRLFGTDKQLSLTAKLAERSQDFRMRYEDPSLFDPQLRLRGDLFSTRKLYPGFTREAAGADLSLTRTIAPHLEVFVGYRAEGVRVEPNDITLATRGTQPAEPLWRGGFLSSLRAGLAYSDVDVPTYPTRGTTIGTTLEVADRELGSDLSYFRTDAWFGHHRPLGPFTLHLGARVRTITDVPISERLHFDGSSDIRGFAPGAIGPKDPGGQPTGGNLLWSARGELEAPLVGDLHVAGFVDVGGLRDAYAGQTAASTGVGLIWRSPIGPLRFDIAFPLTGDDRGPRYIFGIGGMF
ncbi:MAG TPA: BamA/TamA family outer membrane protein [Xanthomonadales bacterium]|nr:BamA/TamA family outer membrane protein [Xanthomonadales bacterium]